MGLLACVCLLAPTIACAAPSEPLPLDGKPASGAWTLTDVRLPGGQATRIAIDGARITAIGPQVSEGALVSGDGAFVVPAFIDSHVHLTYRPEAAAMAAGGIAAAVDLAAPIAALSAPPVAPRVLGAGPMITAPGGYPTQGWGAGGYGVECADEASAIAAVDAAIDAGAGVIKVPLDDAPLLADSTVLAVVARARAAGLKVAAHALSEAGAARAAALGIDVLAHTPVQALSDATVQALAGRAVISTLRAFGGRDDTLSNLTRLRAAGVTVLYGTDFGNTRTAGIDGEELALLARAGLTPAAIIRAATADPATLWGLNDLGDLRAGGAASLLLLASDPLDDLAQLAAPIAVLIDGAVLSDAADARSP